VSFDDGAYRDMVRLARHTTWLNGTASMWSDYGLLLFVLLAAIGLRRSGATWRALWVPGAMVTAYAVSFVVKVGFAERRPCRTLHGVGHIVSACPALGDYSFPSNHAVIAGAAAVAVWRLHRGLGVVAVVNAVVIAASRVYIGVHYPHDVLAGLLLGTLVAWLGGRHALPVLERFGPAAWRTRGKEPTRPARSHARSASGRGDDRVGEETRDQTGGNTPRSDRLASEPTAGGANLEDGSRTSSATTPTSPA
jgi:membrane-associated phospholipid phosphatase